MKAWTIGLLVLGCLLIVGYLEDPCETEYMQGNLSVNEYHECRESMQ